VRLSLHLSQDELARAVRAAGDRIGEPNDASKRLVQRWEAGEVTAPRPVYQRALEYALGVPLASLGFSDAPVARRHALGIGAAMMLIPAGAEARGGGGNAGSGPLTGIWRSHYEYESSGRGGQTFSSDHYCLLLQRGDRVQARSLPNSTPGRFTMDLTVSGQVVTGNWSEVTDPGGYYAGATYHGAIQLLLEPTGHRMTGKWIGFGRDFEVNSGPWTLTLITADVSRESQQEYDRPVEQEQ
jgi:hypothetical protein